MAGSAPPGRSFLPTTFFRQRRRTGQPFSFWLIFLEWAPGQAKPMLDPMIKTWEPYVHAALFTAAVAIIVALIVG